MRCTAIKQQYYRELGASLLIYGAILVPSLVYGPRLPMGMARAVVMVSPMIGFMLMVWAIARQLRRSDEFIRKLQIENIALAAAITAGLSFTYGFLETAGYPRLSMFNVWIVLGISWLLASLMRGSWRVG